MEIQDYCNFTSFGAREDRYYFAYTGCNVERKFRIISIANTATKQLMLLIDTFFSSRNKIIIFISYTQVHLLVLFPKFLK